MSAMSWLREHFGGLPRARNGIAGLYPEPGPFDQPPSEPVELDEADLPWELRDGSPEK